MLYVDVQRDEKIKAELLAYEKSKPSFNQPAQDESSNSDDEDDGKDEYHFIFNNFSPEKVLA